MKTLALFGGSGGLGRQLAPLLDKDYKLLTPTSKEVNVTNYDKTVGFFEDNLVDIVVNASGSNYDSFLHKVTKEGAEKVRRVLDVNIMGTINLLSGCLPHMRSQQYGRVILISSVLAERSILGTAIYSGCKSFIDGLARSVSAENASRGVTCNSIRLGYFDAGILYEIPEDIREDIREKSIGLKRWGEISELHRTIEYLIDTEYVTGTNLSINGGFK